MCLQFINKNNNKQKLSQIRGEKAEGVSSCAPHTHTHTHTREKPGVPERKKSLSAQPWCFLHLSYYYYCRFFFFGLAREHVRSAAVLRGACCLPASKKKKKEEEEEEEEENPMNALFPFAWLNLFSSSFLLAFSFHILTLPRALANKQTNKQTKKKNAYNTAHPRQPHFVLRQETSIFSLHETTNSERLRNERGKKKQEKGRPLLRSCSSFSFCFKHLPIASSFLPFFFFFLQLYTSS